MTMLMQNFWGETRCILGNTKMVDVSILPTRFDQNLYIAVNRCVNKAFSGCLLAVFRSKKNIYEPFAEEFHRRLALYLHGKTLFCFAECIIPAGKPNEAPLIFIDLWSNLEMH